MNDQLKALAKQAGIWFEDTKDVRTHSVSTTTLERFAELIVQECATHMDEYADRTGDDLLDHFGVRE